MKHRTLILVAILTLLAIGRADAQFQDFENDNRNSNNQSGNNNQRYRLIDHLRFGGDFGFGFGSGSVAVQFNPQVGYCFNQYVTAGVIMTYEYYKYSHTYNSQSSSVFGGGLYADATPLDFLVVHAEAQAICYDNYYYSNSNDPDRKVDVPILIGGGYHRQITDRASMNMMLLWNLNATRGLENNTSFTNPVVRVNVTF